MTSAPAAPALSETLKRLNEADQRITKSLDNLRFEPRRSHYEGARNTIRRAAEDIQAALAAPAPAVVGEDERVRRVLRQCLEQMQGCARDHYGENPEGLAKPPLHAEIEELLSAQRPSRDDAGQAVARWEFRAKTGEHWTPWTLCHADYAAWIIANPAGGKNEARPLYAHPPAPSAENGRVGADREHLVSIIRHLVCKFAVDPKSTNPWERDAHEVIAALSGGAK